MTVQSQEINYKGRWVSVPCVRVGNKTVIVTGHWIRGASVYDEDWLEAEAVDNPENFLAQIKSEGLKADYFTFGQRLPNTTPRFNFHMEWDNVAAIPVTSFEDWWQKRLSRKSRQEVTRSERLGITVKTVSFDDNFIGDIVKLFSEIPLKQGMPFAHFGKDFSAVKRDLSSYVDRSQFVGAYCDNKLVGYLKLVLMGKNASILNILANDAYFDKRPTNALIAEAVRICEQKNLFFLQYGKFIYGNKTKSTLGEFKRRNGFEKIELPKYFIPLSLRGRVILKLKLHRGMVGILPQRLIEPLLKLRSGVYRHLLLPLGLSKGSPQQVSVQSQGQAGDESV